MNPGIRSETRRLYTEPEAAGLKVYPCNPDILSFTQASYDPADDSASIDVTGLDDCMLQETARA